MANPLDSFKNLPGWGKAAVIGGGGLAVYALYRYKQNASASSSSSSTTSTANAIDPTTGMPYSEDNTVDPLTGETYLEEAQQYGSVSAAESAVSGGYGATGYGSSLLADESGLAYGSSYSDGMDYGNTDTASTVEFPDNASWAQAAQAGLTGVGYTSTDVSGALGAYLARMPLSSTQVSIVQAAIAEYGPPPVGTYQIVSSSTGGGTTSTGGATVPNVVGMDITDAANAVRADGLSWNGPPSVKGQVIYVTGQTPAAGTSVASGATVTVTVTSTATVSVPNVVGKPIDQAGPAIEAAGLKYSGPAPVKGKVVTITSQTPSAGTKVDPGTTVRCLGKS